MSNKFWTFGDRIDRLALAMGITLLSLMLANINHIL